MHVNWVYFYLVLAVRSFGLLKTNRLRLRCPATLLVRRNKYRDCCLLAMRWSTSSSDISGRFSIELQTHTNNVRTVLFPSTEAQRILIEWRDCLQITERIEPMTCETQVSITGAANTLCNVLMRIA